MAMKIKFPLKMADGSQVRTIEELREHFDLASVLKYYDNGKLVEWLANYYYEEEADRIRVLEPSSADFKRQLCDILSVPYPQNEADDVNLREVSAKNKRLERLKKFTSDDKILEKVDCIAFSQEELADLLDRNINKIYLCGEQFMLPAGIKGVTYIGVNNPVVEFDNDIVESEIDLQGLEFNIDDYLSDNIEDYLKNIEDVGKFYNSFADNSILGVKLLRIAAERGSVKAQAALGTCYMDGFGTGKSDAESIKWFREATAKLQGNERKILIQSHPKLFPLSEVILCAVEGKNNLFGGCGIRLQQKHDILIAGHTNIEIDVYNRHIVNEDILKRLGSCVCIEPKLTTELDEPKTVGGMIVNLFHCKIQEKSSDAPPDYFGKMKKVDTGWGTVSFSLEISPGDEASLEKEFSGQISKS